MTIQSNGRKTMKLKPNEVDQFNATMHDENTAWQQITVFDRNGHGLVSKDQKYGLINQEGEVILSLSYDKIVPAFEGNYSVTKDGKWGFVNAKEEIVIPLEYDLTSDFIDDLCAVKIGDKWGFINKSNEIVIPVEYDGCSDFRFGHAGVMKNQKWGAINKQNQEVMPFEWEYLMSIGDGLFTMGQKSKIKVERPDILARYPYFGTPDYHLIKFGLINLEGKIIARCVSEIPITHFEDGKPIVRVNYQIGTLENFTHFIRKAKYKPNPYDLKILRRLGVIEK